MHTVTSENEQGAAILEECRINDIDVSSRLQLFLPVHELLQPVIEQYSDKVAVVCADTTFTFKELDVFANRFARALVQRGIGHGDLVGVALDRCVELVSVLLAVMKTGAAYVPIEPALPAERINQMMDNACPKLIIIGANALQAFAFPESVCCLSIDEALHMINLDSALSNYGHAAVKSGDLAYVMYTSGSTGQPKGVEITHGGLTNLLLSMQKEPGCNETDRLLAITTVSFDVAVLDWFLPLFCGATLFIAEKHEITDMTAIISLMERHQITIMQGTPSVWQMLLDSGWRGEPRLNKMLSAGEALPRALADRLLNCGDMLWNLYGVTEASVYSSIWRVHHDHDMIIGGPIANTYLYILDENMSPVLPGSPGELCIGGHGVGRGYRNNSKLSQARFPKNPFHSGMMYRTGDVACFTAAGLLSHMGRMDGQVKIRGHRIELGDIEAAITAHQSMSAAVVIGRDDRLVAYCVRNRGLERNGDVKAKLAELGRADQLLRPWLVQRLPAYMVPEFIVEVEAFPVSVNGKIDRKALPDPVGALQTPAAAMMPATELQGRILLIWSRVLGHDRVSINDNFFEIGGNSLRVVRVQKELEKLLGRPVAAAKLFEHFTIKTLAAFLNASPEIPAHPKSVAGQQFLANNSNEDIAIVSMACRLPGDVSTPEEFWELLDRGGDAITDVPEDRWTNNAGLDVRSEPYCQRGGFVPSINSFDISFFGISPREARRLDPSQYMMLETCWEGFERAGYTVEQLRGSQTGVFIGASNYAAHNSLNPGALRDLSDLDGYTVTGSAGGTISGRISYTLGLQGPAMTIDTACSSSLVTTHLACSALRQGECDMAISGGISLMLNPGLHVEFSRLQGMSPDGRCRSFSADTQGTGWSEGSVVVLLKRLSDAQRDGNFIHAVLRGTAVNNDGRSASLTAPSGSAQQRLIRTALASARLQPDDIDYVEAHGTATKLGDPIEATALAEVFGPGRAQREPLLIGAAKSNIGHTQGASGLVGLLKVMLAMQHSVLPQTLHITNPTPAVDWQRANMKPVLNKRPWISQGSRLRRAGVSAFGIGGTNAHVIVQEAPRQVMVAEKMKTAARLPHHLPFLLSGDTDRALLMQAEKLQRHINSPTHQDNLSDMAYSLAATRSHFRKRLVLMARDKAELSEKLKSDAGPQSITFLAKKEAVEAPRLAMLFAGQGSQWPGMGKDMCEIYPIFAEAIREIAGMFDIELATPLLDVMWADPGSAAATLLDRTDFAQPALFALEVALWKLWQSWGVTPDFVMGHSLGELVAAHVAGILDLPDACRLVAARGRLMQAQSGHLSMASLEASTAESAVAVDQLGHSDKVDVAANNTPTHTVISGDTDAVESIKSYFAARGRKTKTLVVGHAFHSRHMDGMLVEFRAVAETVRFRPPQISIISSLEGALAKTGQLEEAHYWVKQARGMVRFGDGIQVLARQGIDVFLELGPDQVLCGMGAIFLADHAQSGSILWLPSLGRRKESPSILQRSMALLHMRNVPIDWDAFFEPFSCKRVQLPTYAFQREFHVRHDPSTQSNGAGINENGTDLSNGTSLSNGARLSNGTGTKISSAAHRGSQSNQGHNQFGVTWHSIQMDSIHPTGTWGLVMPPSESRWATSVKTTLLSAGLEVIQVEHLKYAEKLEGVVCLWDLDVDQLTQTRAVMTEALTQLQTAAWTQLVPPLVWFTHQAVGTGDNSDDGALRLGPGPLLWGLMRTARSEYPELHLRLVDLGRETTGAYITSALMLNTEPECAVRQDRVLVPRLQRVDPVSKLILAKHRLVRSDGAVLITGGLGDLGARVARWLASSHDAYDLVLISRHGMGASDADALVEELSSLGARVTVMTGDVANPDTIRSVIAMFNNDRPLRGVVHAAGVVDSGVLSTMTPERCETTIAPKVYGAWNLHQATQHMDLDLFMMFSSISGIMGMPGLANYAASNSFLDALSHLRRAQGLPATSVAYGTWAGDGGMASRLGSATLTHLSQYGLDPLPPDEGLELFQQAVVSRRPLTIAAVLDLERLRAYLEEQGSGMPPLLSSLLTRKNTSLTQASSGRQHLLRALSEAEPGQHAGIVLNMVQQAVAKAMGFTNLFDVEVDRPLKDIGIDSLTATQTRNHLATLTGLTLSVNIVFLHSDLRKLSESLLTQLKKADVSFNAVMISRGLNATTLLRGCLDNGIVFQRSTMTRTSHLARRPESVFLTGATGFVGVFILHQLLKQGIPTHCLVRAYSVDKAQQRLESTLREYGLWEPKFVSLISPVVGDIAQPLLGMTDQVFNEMSQRVDAICHSGALVDWLRPLQDYVGPNIASAHEILRLASRGRVKAVHLVSTISTLPKHMGLDLKEGDLEYGYGTSKYMAERLVAAARWRGARAAIYRLPYVTASTMTGHYRLDRGDFLHNFITGSLQMGAFPSVNADMSAVLPVDYLAKTIVTIMTLDFHRLGRDFDFLSTRAPTCSEFFNLMGTLSSGKPKKMLAFSAWKQRALDYAAEHPKSPLARITAVLDGYTDETVASMFKGVPVGEHVLGGDEYPAPPIDEEFINVYLNRINSLSGN